MDPRTEDLTTEALICRSEGGRHTFKPIAEATRKFSPRKSGIEMQLKRECQYCDVEALESFDIRTGERIQKRTLHYPPGYLLPKPDVPGTRNRLSADAARAAMFSRMLK